MLKLTLNIKTRGFLMFSEGIEIEHWLNID